MESPSTVVLGAVPAAEPIDRGRFRARITGKSLLASPDSTYNRPAFGATYTLRIKPDRRSVQIPIAPGSDRRLFR